MALVEIERDGAVAILTLNRPEAMNALSAAMRAELAETIEQTAADEAVRVLILTGAGDRAFTAGLDLKEVAKVGLPRSAGTNQDPVVALGACPKPVIGAVNGVAITGGFELALACDILIASTHARFADTHVRVGVVPGWGLSQRLSRRIGISRAKEMSLSGNFIDAETALAWGLVNRVVAPEALLVEALRLAQDIASCDPTTVLRYKALIDDGFALPFGDAMALEAARARAANVNVTPEGVAARREAVQARGRDQAG
jgi:enoyl-CoA hydratase